MARRYGDKYAWLTSEYLHKLHGERRTEVLKAYFTNHNKTDPSSGEHRKNEQPNRTTNQLATEPNQINQLVKLFPFFCVTLYMVRVETHSATTETNRLMTVTHTFHQ